MDLQNILSQNAGQLAVCGIAASFAGWFSWVVSSIVMAPRPSVGNPFEQKRREQARQQSRFFELTEPLIHETSRFVAPLFPGILAQLKRDLPLVHDRDTNAEEFLGRSIVTGACFSVLMFVLMNVFSSIAATVLSGFVLILYAGMECRSITKAAMLRRRIVRLRLPFAVDMIALMMEAGGGFPESLQALVDEQPGHPVGQELARVCRDIKLGRPRTEALQAFQNRMNDADVSELVFAINRGDELGTPLGEILRSQATQMQLKRAQWGEIAAAEAEIKMLFPGMLVMMACLLVILSTFLLPARKFF